MTLATLIVHRKNGFTVTKSEVTIMQNENNSLKVYIVQGRVEDGNDRALAGLLVKAYDRDLRSESVLGESLTDRKGAYKITYTPESFLAKEKKTADLFLRVFTSGGNTSLF